MSAEERLVRMETAVMAGDEPALMAYLATDALAYALVNVGRQMEQRLNALGELRVALAACRRAMRSTQESLTEQARRDVHMYLSAELDDDEAAEEWREMALEKP